MLNRIALSRVLLGDAERSRVDKHRVKVISCELRALASQIHSVIERPSKVRLT